MEESSRVPAFAMSQEYYQHPDFALAGVTATRGPQHPENGLGTR